MNTARTITGLDPMQDILCATIDVSEKITIDDETPTTKQFLAFVPTVDRTLYQTIDAASDININILPTLSAATAQDELIIYDATDGTNKKISATSLETVYTAGVGITLANNQFTFTGGDILTAPIKTTGAIKSGTLESDGDTTVNGYLYCNDTVELQGNDIDGGGTVYSQELNLSGKASVGGQLRVYNASGGGTITDNFSGATGSNTGMINNLNTSFFQNGITGGTAPQQIGGGAIFAPAGSGSGQQGFDSSLPPQSTPDYFLFTGNNTRQLTTINIRSYLSQGGTVSCYYIQGNSQNGGENADNNEDLVLEILGLSYNLISSSTISSGITPYPNNVFSLFTHSLTSSEVASGYYIRFKQSSSSQSTFDTYGLKWLNLQYGGLSDIRFENLPTALTAQTGRLWNNNGVLSIS